MTELVLYKQLADVIGAAGDAISKITDGIKHLVTTGLAGYNYIAAERERKRLIDLSARATNLQAYHQPRVVRDIDEYLSKSNPTMLDWYVVKSGIAGVIEEIKELLDDVRNERSDFVLEEAYERLTDTLGARISLLEKLSKIAPPSSKEEREALRQINQRYKKLLSSFREAIDQLNLYLKNKPGNGGSP